MTTTTPTSQSLLNTLTERLNQKYSAEGLEIEYKAASGGLPKSLWATVSAFANTIGGWIILGVREDESSVSIDGIEKPSEMLQDFYNLTRNPQKISCPPCGADDAAIEDLNGKQLIVLRIPAAARKQRPVYVNGHPYEGTYLRRNSGDYHCNKQEVDRMMREASDVAADSTILDNYTWKDIDQDSLLHYRRRYRTASSASPYNTLADEDFFRIIGGYKRNRETGKEGISVAGLLLLGKEEAIREWRTRHLIDFRFASGGERLEDRWNDRVAWEGNLYSAYDAIYPKLIANPTVPSSVPFRLVKGTRVDEKPVEIAMREALVNLLVHADYSETQASLIIRSAEGYAFRNPGSSRVMESELFSGERSDPRNPLLVRMFRVVGLAEEAGSGMTKIVQAWRELGLQLPEINVGTEKYEFNLQLHHSHLISAEDRTWLASLANDWSEAEQLALVIAKHEGYVDNTKLRKVTGQHSADVSKILVGLRDKNHLMMNPAGKNTRYELSGIAAIDLASTNNSLPLFDKPIAVTTSGGSSLISGGTASSSREKGVSSGETASSSGEMSSVSGERDDTHERLLAIASKVRETKRISSATLQNVLVGMCSLKPLSLKEMAKLTNRQDETLRDIVRTLLDSSRLFYLYPERPSSPKQMYTAKKFKSKKR